MTNVPPQNLEAEENVLGAILLSPSALTAVSDAVRPSDFYRESHGIIFQAALDMAATGEPVDAITVTNALEEQGKIEAAGGRTRIWELPNLVTATANAEHHAHIVRETATARALVEAGKEIARLGHLGGSPEQLDQAQQLLYAISENRGGGDLRILGDTAIDIYKDLHARAERGGLSGAPTGIRELDKLLGGLRPGALILLAARPGKGKSSLALNIAQHLTMRQDLPVALFTFEMTRREVAERLLASEALISTTTLRDGTLNAQEFRRASEAATSIQQAPLYAYDRRDLTSLQLRTKVRRLKAQQPGLALCIVDYLQLMVSGEAKHLVAETGKVSQALKVLAGELGVPVLALSQLNRMSENEKRKPRASDLRDSGSLEQDADVIVFIHHTEEPGVAHLLIEKNRNGPDGVFVPVSWRGQYTNFSDLVRLQVAS